MDPKDLVAIMASGGGGAALLALITGFVKWVSGSSAREREKNTDLIRQRRNAIEERDAANLRADQADERRRIQEEYSSSLRRQLIENGLTPGEKPIDQTIPRPQD